MRISYSHIAWEAADETAAAEILRDTGLDAVDVAPARYFPDPATATRAEAERVRDWWCGYGIEVLGMQALLFGTQGLNLFGPPEVRQRMLDRLAAVCRVAGWMGARRLVFGSPKNRDRGGLDDAAVAGIAIPWLRSLGEVASAEGVVICLEPNPPCYACNFMTGTDEAAAVVRQVGHPGIRLHIDAGTLAINGEDPAAMIAAHTGVIGYLHVSEPDLVPVETGRPVHAALAQAVRARLPDLPVSIEMKAAGLGRVREIASAVKSLYGT